MFYWKCMTSISQFINYPYCWTYTIHALHKNWIKFFKNQTDFFFLLKLKITLFYLLPVIVTRCTTCCHSLSLAVIRCHSLYDLLPLNLPLVCLFIKGHVKKIKIRNQTFMFCLSLTLVIFNLFCLVY